MFLCILGNLPVRCNRLIEKVLLMLINHFNLASFIAKRLAHGPTIWLRKLITTQIKARLPLEIPFCYSLALFMSFYIYGFFS
jgi:hypothetical protein